MRFPEPREYPSGGMVAVGGAGGDSLSLGCESWTILCHRAGPCENSSVLLWAQTRCWFGPSEDCLEQDGSRKARGAALASSGECPRRMPLSWCFVVASEDQFCCELLFSVESDIFQMVWTLSMCRSLSHRETNKKKIRKNKTKTKNCWRWWPMMHFLFAD